MENEESSVKVCFKKKKMKSNEFHYGLCLHIYITEDIIKYLNWGINDQFSIICNNENPYRIKIVKNWRGIRFHTHTESGSSFKISNWTPFIPKTQSVKDVIFVIEGEELELFYREENAS